MYALVSLNFDVSTTTEQLSAFASHLRDNRWQEFEQVPSSWFARFDPQGSEMGIRSASKRDITEAAREARIIYYHAVIHVGRSKPICF